MQEIRNWHAKCTSVTYYFPYRLSGSSFILAAPNAFCIRMPVRLLLTHWTRLWTIRKHINGTQAFICSGTIPIILHMKRICAMIIWQNSRVIFLSLVKEVPFCALQASPCFGIFKFYRQVAQNAFLLLFYASFSLLIITKNVFLKTGYIYKNLWNSSDKRLWDRRYRFGNTSLSHSFHVTNAKQRFLRN